MPTATPHTAATHTAATHTATTNTGTSPRRAARLRHQPIEDPFLVTVPGWDHDDDAGYDERTGPRRRGRGAIPAVRVA